jgi:phosphate starvation-inducible PhoH-like protein
MLLQHVHRFGHITPDQIKEYINLENAPFIESQNDDVILFGNKGLVIKPKSPNQKKLVDAAFKNDLVFALGPAGTGKTYIAVALAVRALKNREVKRIIITRPAVEAGENLGFLPGDLQEKLDPYLRPIYDALSDMVPPEKLKFYQETRVIEIAPLAYMRGRTLHDAFVLLDEAQNTTSEQIKMFLTRMGPNSKVIITGDQTQVDLPKRQKSGLKESLHVLRDVKGIGIVNLSGKDVIRHKLVKSIIDAYDRHDAQKDEKRENNPGSENQ